MKKIVISSSNLIHNVTILKELLNINVKFCAVVKSNAYGHGFEIVKIIESQVDYFAVATCEEALILRKNYTQKPILILGYVDERNMEEITRNDIEFCVFSYENLLNIPKQAKIHIMLNTGMNRLGVSSLKELKKIEKYCCDKEVNIVGICSHFYNAEDEKSCDEQNVIFTKMLQIFKEHKNLIIHISSTNSTILYKKFNYSMVRCGIGIYGYCDIQSFNSKLRPVMQIFGIIVQKNKIKQGSYVSYGFDYKSERNQTVCVVNCGYFDGIMRKNKNTCNALSNGEYLKICGNICMDMMMVEEGKKKLKIGDEVCVLSDASVSAKSCATNSYEIMTSIKRDRFKYVIE